MKTPITIEMDIRKEAIASMIYDAKTNPDIDNDDMITLFEAASKQLEYYKYFGENDRIVNFLDNEITNNTNGLKAFLEQDLGGYTIYQTIITKLA